MSSNFLQKILPSIQERVTKIKGQIEILQEGGVKRKPHLFSGEGIIAEIKFTSPSLGVLSSQNDTLAIAAAYLNAGASAISVLTEPYYFNGSLEYLKEIREAFPEAILLRKDFIIDEVQLYESLSYGADAVLLIVALLEEAQLERYYHLSIALGLSPLIEVHTLKELAIALRIGAKIIGINNRDLVTLKIDLSVSETLIRHAPHDVVFISESGICTAGEMIWLQSLGIKGFLIGSSLMKKGNPGQALCSLLRGVEDAR